MPLTLAGSARLAIDALGGVTVSVAPVLTAPTLALMVACPAAIPCTMPAPFTIATPGADEVQLIELTAIAPPN